MSVDLPRFIPGHVLIGILKHLCSFSLREFLVLKSILPSHNRCSTLANYLITSKFEAADEMMAKVQHQFQEVKMYFKARISSKKKLHT